MAGLSWWEKRFFTGLDRCSVCGQPRLTGLTFTESTLVFLSLLGAWEGLALERGRLRSLGLQGAGLGLGAEKIEPGRILVLKAL